LETLELIHGFEESGKARVPVSIGIHVLAKERDFLNPLEDQSWLRPEVPPGDGWFLCPHIRNNAVRTEVVAPFHNGDERLTCV